MGVNFKLNFINIRWKAHTSSYKCRHIDLTMQFNLEDSTLKALLPAGNMSLLLSTAMHCGINIVFRARYVVLVAPNNSTCPGLFFWNYKPTNEQHKSIFWRVLCTKDLKVTYCNCFLFSISSQAAQACVTGLNCVTNIPLKVITQLGQRGFQQIMVAGRRTSHVDVNAGRVLQRITCLMSHICHWWGLKFQNVIHFGFIELYIKDTMWLKPLDGFKSSKNYQWMVCVSLCPVMH